MKKFRVCVYVRIGDREIVTVDIPSDDLVDCAGVYVQVCEIYCTDVDEVATGAGDVPLLKRWLRDDGIPQDGYIVAMTSDGSYLSKVTITNAQVTDKW